jgi:hypothetical protein
MGMYLDLLERDCEVLARLGMRDLQIRSTPSNH